jgi:cellulose synthase/poly-beta-1,6-N-acetylglucosamine synthase-like glycosyltransferase
MNTDLFFLKTYDYLLSQDWIKQIIDPLADPTIVGCKGVYTSQQNELVARFVQIEYEDKYDRLYDNQFIDFIDTYSAADRRETLLANVGFDELIRDVEDQELSFRLASRGYKMVFRPQAAVRHLHRNTLAAYFLKKFMIGYWKVKGVRRFPARGLTDSHTPQILKLQMLLAPGFLISLFATIFFVKAISLVLIFLVLWESKGYTQIWG